MWKICRWERRNLATWPAEFGKICRGKLWSLLIVCITVTKSDERDLFHQTGSISSESDISRSIGFLFLTHYVPNVAKEELWDQCKKYEYWRPTNDRRPQGPFTHFAKISNGHNSATRQPIPFMFVLGWGFRGQRIQRHHFRLAQIQDGGRRPSGKTSNG